MKNRVFLIIIALSTIVSLIGKVMCLSSEIETIEIGSKMFNYGLDIVSFVGFVMLLSNGTFLKTKYFKFAQAFISIIMIGAFLKIMHFSGYTNFIIILGEIGVVVCYFVHFMKKPIKIILDYLKLL